jgi:hypothetical protein
MSATDTKVIVQNQPTEQEKQEFKRRLFETADRSFLNDRFTVPLPPDMYGEWVGTDDFSQFNAQQKGFVDGVEYLTKFNKVHEQADGKSTIGDVKFMVIPKWKHEAHQEILALQASRKSGLNAHDLDAQEKAYAKSIGLEVMNDRPSARLINGDELNAQLKRI